ncbi:hypothetical protein A0H81_15037 [Grifola frondosa]|uniref:Uncharacterized protein n=1 Tax=Grifola frondosa TaxID=5627 RepID=A0A1C7LL55_GRIFR|nr:hypothetical protein A0H81_15037 [Grifola frondosa]
MPHNYYTGEDYNVTSRGVNDQGNAYDHRVSSTGDHSYHYSNKDGGYYYHNSDNSRYYNSGNGYSSYTSADGHVSKCFKNTK